MLEKAYEFTIGKEKIIEKIVEDEKVMINHVVLEGHTGLPEHYSNSNVYLIIVKGTMGLRLGDEEENEYTKGSIISIPYKVKMNLNNVADGVLEFFIVKAPHPDYFE
ncbi:cupin domain-containing protein [Anaerobium acetethylicum]|uniref:Mannose-6-phosphate isomerase, cupin superfamily n=1 Tax=Anaerobium acetethylicum TaxID=1619234 RepID=A0A1D3TSZ8_9FIRM|nr:cupin domain-containing protein [Anaerobium acetethylicum]SCP97072.1 hypothetical protein SAMN05421730_100845 [Anaerobium acetethylicum]